MTKMSDKEVTNEDWVMNITEELDKSEELSRQDRDRWNQTSIYKVPLLISHHNKNAYTPKLVSIGPFHHMTDHLLPMEAHKRRAVCCFLQRLSPPSTPKLIYDKLREVAQDLMDSYDSLTWNDTREKFVEMMITDGCFMLEIFRAHTTTTDYKEDPVFGDHGKSYVMPFVRRDMLMLENQLPMLVLHILSGIYNDNDQSGIDKLYKDILSFCNADAKPFSSAESGQCLHVLELYRKSLLGGPTPPVVQSSTSPNKGDYGVVYVRSATELQEAGVNLETIENRLPKEVSFKHGKLRLPSFVVDDDTESKYLNLIAFERCHAGAGHDITSFITFMDNLIDNPQDISLLCTKGIIHNLHGSDSAAAELFNTMAKDLAVDPRSDLKRVQLDTRNYCQRACRRHRASFCHSYCRSPWASISIIAAIILFILTLMQTIFSELQLQQGMEQSQHPRTTKHMTWFH